MKQFAQGHTARHWQSQDYNQGCVRLRLLLLCLLPPGVQCEQWPEHLNNSSMGVLCFPRSRWRREGAGTSPWQRSSSGQARGERGHRMGEVWPGRLGLDPGRGWGQKWQSPFHARASQEGSWGWLGGGAHQSQPSSATGWMASSWSWAVRSRRGCPPSTARWACCGKSSSPRTPATEVGTPGGGWSGSLCHTVPTPLTRTSRLWHCPHLWHCVPFLFLSPSLFVSHTPAYHLHSMVQGYRLCWTGVEPFCLGPEASTGAAPTRSQKRAVTLK